MTSQPEHFSVLLNESLAGLAIKSDGFYIDGTFGRGGHSQAILKQLGPNGRLVAFDQDPQAVEYAKNTINDARFKMVYASFADLLSVAEQAGWIEQVDGMLLDLGVSSPQLDDAERGFSFMREGPLDMRMNPAQGLSAKDWLIATDEEQLAKVLKHFGEERFAYKIARAVSHDAKAGLLSTTKDLADLVARVVPKKDKHKHPATRTFQAIRIAVNGELDALKLVLDASLAVLAPSGRLSVISFHSLEDRIVKQFIRDQSQVKDLFPDLPVLLATTEAKLKRIGKAIFPTAQECSLNVRSRSAVLRIAEKI